MLAVVSLNHKTAPLDVREQVAVSEIQISTALKNLAAGSDTTEVLLLSTCNRTEVYLTTADRPPVDRIATVLTARRGIPADLVLPYLSVLDGEEAARHALRVAGGLESMIVGEPQILGQVRRALTAARHAGTTGPVLNRLMQVAIACGRRIHAETDLGRRAASVPHAALSRARRVLDGLTDRRLVIVGAGEMSELIAKVFVQAGARLGAVANRTVPTAQALAARYGAPGISLDELRSAIAGTDILVVSVGAELPVLGRTELEDGHDRRAPLVVIDLGVPRGVDPAARSLRHVTFYDLDDLAPAGVSEVSEDDLARASDIVEEALDALMRWLSGRAAVPVIAALHRRAERIIADELHRARGRLLGLDEHQHRAVRGVVEAALRKLLHAPFVRLRAEGNDARVLTLARELFDLDSETGEDRV